MMLFILCSRDSDFHVFVWQELYIDFVRHTMVGISFNFFDHLNPIIFACVFTYVFSFYLRTFSFAFCSLWFLTSINNILDQLIPLAFHLLGQAPHRLCVFWCLRLDLHAHATLLSSVGLYWQVNMFHYYQQGKR